MALHILIVEDEPANARNLEHLLRDIDPTIVILEKLPGVAETVAWLKANGPSCDLLFMDIHLTDGHSFDIFEQVRVTQPVIFVTAYDNYALKAFKTNGIDYILKPYDPEEITRALNKYKQFTQNATPGTPTNDLHQVIRKLYQERPVYKNSFLIHFREKLLPLQTNQIAWCYTANELVYAGTFQQQQFLIDFTLEQLQQQLDPALFFRANRQFIVQRKAITEVHFYFNGRLLVNTQPETKEKILISKARVPEFKEWMNN